MRHCHLFWGGGGNTNSCNDCYRWLFLFPGIKYNAEKDEKEKQAAKQKKLQALEEAKKLEAEKGLLVCHYDSSIVQLFFCPHTKLLTLSSVSFFVPFHAGDLPVSYRLLMHSSKVTLEIFIPVLVCFRLEYYKQLFGIISTFSPSACSKFLKKFTILLWNINNLKSVKKSKK